MKRSKESKKFKYGALVSIIVLITMVIGIRVSQNNTTETEASPYSSSALDAQEQSYDFGTISMAKGEVVHKFTVENKGNEPVRIEKVYTSCMCTSAVLYNTEGKKVRTFGMQGHGGSPKTNVEIGVGESVEVEAVFDPAAHGPSGVGPIQRIITLESNSQAKPKTEIKISANVTP